MLFLLFFLHYSHSSNLSAIVPKTQQEVESTLAKAEKVELYKPKDEKCKCTWFHYRDGQVRIVTKEGKTDRANWKKQKINKNQCWLDKTTNNR